MFGIFGVHGVVGRTPETARNRIGTQWHNVGVQRNGKRHNGMSVGQWRLPMDNGDFRHPKEVYAPSVQTADELEISAQIS